jgi:hypothetical protein
MHKLARSNAEAHLYMSMNACACGETRFTGRPKSAVMTADGELASRYDATCAGCGTARRFDFRLPATILPPLAQGVRFGGDEPSELLDPGEWLLVADDHAQRVPAAGAGPTIAGGGEPERALAVAIAALDEILKFFPPGAEECPAEAFSSVRGKAAHAAEPARFQRARLAAARAAYAAVLQQS